MGRANPPLNAKPLEADGRWTRVWYKWFVTFKDLFNADALATVLNTAHRLSDGKDHSDVVLNNTHRAGDGKDHSDVVLNNTHRSSDGKDHSDVVLNNTHRSSDGTDHTYIDQDVTTTASPTFVGAIIGGIKNLIEAAETRLVQTNYEYIVHELTVDGTLTVDGSLVEI